MRKSMKVVFVYVLFICTVLASCAKNINNISLKPTKDEAMVNFSDKRVLMISSYSPSFRTFYKQIDGVKRVFDPYHIQLDNEFMDTKRFYTDENLSLFLHHLRYKIQHLPPYDAIITADDDAIDFVMLHREELFPNTPIFFLGVNNYWHALAYSKEENVTGVFEAPSYDETIALARKLNPKAKRIVGLVDGTTSGKGDLELFLAEQKKMSDVVFVTIDLSELTFEEFEERLETCRKDDIIVLISVYRDSAGKTCTFEEGLEMVLNHIKAPLYHTYEHGIGEGVLGGMIVSHQLQGQRAASQVLEYLKGTPVKDIDLVDESPNQYMIDWKIFQSYNLNEKVLPLQTVFINREETFMEHYGKVIVIALVITLLEGIIIASLLYFIRKLKMRDHEIYNLIYYDKLTGLSNRFAIYEKMERQIKAYPEQQFYVMFLDIDNFKNVNDLYGHDVGDALIKEIGRQFLGFLDADIQAGRFGGDEFVFLIAKPLSEERLIAYIERVRLVCKECLRLKKQFFYITLSIGVVKYPQHGITKEELIKKSDIALYEAKRRGKDQYVIFDDKMNRVLEEQITFQEMLRVAFHKNEFELYFQPLISTKNNKIIGFEALIRWHNEKLGWVSPYRMITVAEEMGFIIQLGEWIFTEAVKFTKEINQYSKEPIKISINISMIQLAYSGFYPFVMETLNKYKVRPNQLSLEMTETIFMKREDAGNKVLTRLSEAGFSISLDDFGTGYSSLSYLKQFKIDYLKIDRFFIDNFVKDEYDQKLVALIIEVAKQKSAFVVAEGVENQEQYQLLKDMDCQIVQGYFISKPLPATQAIEFLETFKGIKK